VAGTQSFQGLLIAAALAAGCATPDQPTPTPKQTALAAIETAPPVDLGIEVYEPSEPSLEEGKPIELRFPRGDVKFTLHGLGDCSAAYEEPPGVHTDAHRSVSDFRPGPPSSFQLRFRTNDDW
jgi:hypothetical protein